MKYRFILSSKIGLVLPILLGAAFAPLTHAQEPKTPEKAADPTPAIKFDPTPLPQVAGTISTFAPVVDKVSPSVVTIATSKMVKQQQAQNPNFNDPMFRKFFGLPDPDEQPDENSAPKGRNGRRHPQMLGLGSGVIVSANGLILTNNHVIEGADEIMVTLGNEHHEYKAKKIGTDPSTDIAILKIEPNANVKLHPITFADSDKIHVGDVAIAVGNPFGLTQSVTMGIVSAIGRGGTGISEYENFIQTDASINPGNSGGALVDTEGRLIGINTAIFSRSGGNQGIGFAVPANLARGVMESILKTGHVTRGFLGIGLQPLSDELAKEFKIDDDAGALVTSVSPKSPAEKAGVREGDVVVDVDSKKVEGPRELQLMVAAMAPGTKVDVKVIRDGKEKIFNIELAERPGSRVAANDSSPAKATDPDVLDGVTVGDIDEAARKKFDIPEGAKGVVITELEQDSPSAEAGLKPGDVIHEINREPVTTAKQAVDMSEKVKKEKKVLLRVSTKGSSRYVIVEHKDQ
jgi:serine protease Do